MCRKNACQASAVMEWSGKQCSVRPPVSDHHESCVESQCHLAHLDVAAGQEQGGSDGRGCAGQALLCSQAAAAQQVEGLLTVTIQRSVPDSHRASLQRQQMKQAILWCHPYHGWQIHEACTHTSSK